jgi:hypothetical protein
MPNGAHHPQCYTCANCDRLRLADGADRRACRLHDFVMPILPSEEICRDWARPPETQPYRLWVPGVKDPRLLVYDPEELPQFPNGLAPLEPGYLYTYGYHSADPPWDLGTFESLQRLLIQADINRIPRVGWAIVLHRSLYRCFSEPGSRATLVLDDQVSEADVRTVRWRRPWGRRDDGRGGFKPSDFRTETERMLVCRDAPEPLSAWLDRHTDLRAWLDKRTRTGYVGWGHRVLIEVEEEQSRYRLRFGDVGVKPRRAMPMDE